MYILITVFCNGGGYNNMSRFIPWDLNTDAGERAMIDHLQLGSAGRWDPRTKGTKNRGNFPCQTCLFPMIPPSSLSSRPCQ